MFQCSVCSSHMPLKPDDPTRCPKCGHSVDDWIIYNWFRYSKLLRRLRCIADTIILLVAVLVLVLMGIGNFGEGMAVSVFILPIPIVIRMIFTDRLSCPELYHGHFESLSKNVRQLM